MYRIHHSASNTVYVDSHATHLPHFHSLSPSPAIINRWQFPFLICTFLFFISPSTNIHVNPAAHLFSAPIPPRQRGNPFFFSTFFLFLSHITLPIPFIPPLLTFTANFLSSFNLCRPLSTLLIASTLPFCTLVCLLAPF